ncbi:hypothetical protein AMECASPLE_014194 [Ameca splendens]|uniref:Uncharacterized protein n=1 Tax=Ameca splendens TaxID=208324 RepID=A0ABV0YNK2_9TELE
MTIFDTLSSIYRMNATMFYSFLQKKTKLALPVNGSEDELGFSDEENEQLATHQGESEDDRDSENEEDYEPENEDSRNRKERGDSEGESAVTVHYFIKIMFYQILHCE